MNILELFEEENIPDYVIPTIKSSSDDMDFSNVLKNHGWKYVTGGNFSSIYTNKNKNYVLKVNHKPDPAYARFVKLIQNEHSKYLPIIVDKKLFYKNKKAYNVYLIEKLYPATPEMVNNIKYIVREIDHMRHNQHIFDKDQIEQDITITYYDFLNKYQGLFDILYKITTGSSNKARLDIHEGNVMMRKDKTPVIIDPYAGE